MLKSVTRIIFLVIGLAAIAWFFCFARFTDEVFGYLKAEEQASSKEQEYIQKLFNNQQKDRDFVAYKEYGKLKSDVNLIALYLPQFHQFKENNLWHGRGFTEWTNVTAAKPMFAGHYQPKIPIDVGFYDLSHDDVMYRQIELAKNYGISGFAFYYYWFSGKKLMEKPIYNYLQNKELDLPFCLHWANENWTKKWDGGNKEVLIEQNFSRDDFEKFAQDLLEFFKDERYIRIKGRPLFIIYHPALFEKKLFKEFAEYLKEFGKKNGVGEPYMVATRQFWFYDDPKEWGLDAVMEFEIASAPSDYTLLPPDNIDSAALYKRFDHAKFINSGKEKKIYKYKTFRTVFPSWDNTARKAYSNAYIFDGATPYIYGKWLDYAIKATKRDMDKDEQIVFINAWNEWGEGAYLEPDKKYGYAYLDMTRQVLDGKFDTQSATNEKNNKVGIAVLTGGRKRIAKGLELLDEGKGARMLISGVSEGVTLYDIAELEGVTLYDDMPVDLGYKARTTVGNAKEIKAWVEKNGYQRLIAVTSFYHIPRSLLELQYEMPETGIRFVAVSSGYVRKQWWKHWGSFCFLAAEYCKYLAVKLKYAFK